MNLFKRIGRFYCEAFTNTALKRRLWTILIIKLFIIFVLLKLIFFPDFLKSNFQNEKDRGDYVREQLINRK